MNNEYSWNCYIQLPKVKKDSVNAENKYTLYATGDCDIRNGRQYVSLPSDLKITEAIKKKYNLM